MIAKPKKKIRRSNLPVAMLSKDGKVVSVFNTMKEASIYTGVNYGSISQCCAKVQTTAGGYKWEYR